MKYTLITAGLTVIMSLGLSSCGKKAADHKNTTPQDVIEEVTPEALEQETHKDLKAAIVAGDAAKVKSILSTKKQIDLNILLDNSETLMTMATARNQPQIVELLLENFASITRSNSKKESPLMVAAKSGHENLVRLFVSLGVKTDSKNIDGNTALLLSILNLHESIALYLINSNTNIDITNNDNLNALKLAEIQELHRVVALLRGLTQSSIGSVNKLTVRDLITLGDVENLNQLLERHPSVIKEYQDLNFYVLIMRSHRYDKASALIELFIKHKAPLTAPADANETPLIEAIKSGYNDFALMFLSANADPNIADHGDVSPLMWAIRKNSDVTVKALLVKGAEEKYVSYVTGKKKTIKACDEARSVRSTLTTEAQKKTMEAIMVNLKCGLRGIF